MNAENSAGATGPGATGPDETGPDLSRRTFLAAAAGGAALTLIDPSDASARSGAGRAPLDDYVGRLCYNENPLGPSPLAITALTEQATLAHRYPDWYANSLRSDLASLHGVGTGQVIAGCGATEILRLCALGMVDPTGNVVCPYPSYSQFPSDAGFLGAEVRYSNLDANHRVDLADAASRVDGQTAVVCLTNANNPTGTVLAATDIAAFVDALPSHVVTVVDEAYHEFIHDTGYATAIGLVTTGRKVVVIRTFSKVYGLAGARIGYAVGPSTEIGAMNAWHLYATVSRPSSAAARAALGDSQHVADTVTLNDQAKQLCYDGFDLMGLSYIPSETNFFMVDVGTSAGTVASELAARGIQVRTGWGMPQHLRVSTGTLAEMQDFLDALADILGISTTAPLPLPRVTSLGGNHPNPFRTSTQADYTLAADSPVLLQVFNVRGQLVRTMVDRPLPRGRHTFTWDGTDERGAPVASGSYFCRLQARDVSQTRRMILIR